MTADITLFISFFLTIFVLGYPLAGYMLKVFTGQKNLLTPIMQPLERATYKLCHIDTDNKSGAFKYIQELMYFSISSVAVLFLILYFQDFLPLNSESLPGLSWHLSLNTAVSFVTNTNWQSYGGESTLSYFSQMAGLTVQNYLSAAAGISVAVALMRGISAKENGSVGSFYVDLVRVTLYVLIPICIVYALFLVSQGVIQNFSPTMQVKTLEGATQTFAMGPVASQEAIKMLGTNGGGFFNANSAHPFENPTALSNFVQTVSIFLIPTALVFMFGKMVGNKKEGFAILGAMLILFVVALSALYLSEKAGNPILANLGLSGDTAMEGKEVRFGIGGSSLFATVTTAASCGAVNTMHDSLTPIGGLVTMAQMLVGEVVFGGVGAGFYGMIAYLLIAVFLCALMIGKTPNYFGKKIEGLEIKAAMIAFLLPAAAALLFSSWALLDTDALKSLANPNSHGLSEVLYAYASAVANNGSAFAGLNANTPFYDTTLAICMFVGRFGVIIPMLVVAGSLASKKRVQDKTVLPTDTLFFAFILACTVILLGALTFFPVLALGPIVEHLQMISLKTF